MAPERLVVSRELRREARGWVCRHERPGDGWHAHGYTTKRLVLLDEDRLVVVEVHKQRWREVATGRTRHDRPPRDVSWAHFGLAVVFRATWAWMNSPRGLHDVAWPWGGERPSRRTAQRWMARLLVEGLVWQAAIRAVVCDHLAPRTLDGVFPAGLPPPGTVARWRSSAAEASRLSRGLVLLTKCAPLLSLPWDRLLVEARIRLSCSGQL